MRRSRRSFLLVVALLAAAPHQALAWLSPEAALLGWTVDGRFLVADKGGPLLAVDARSSLVTEVDVSEREAWLNKHPLAARAETPPEEPAVDLALASKRDFSSRSITPGLGDQLRCTVTRGERALTPLTFTFSKAGTCTLDWELSPDGRRIGFFLVDISDDADPALPEGANSRTFDVKARAVVDRAQGPRIQVVARGAARAAVPKVIELLEQAGYVPTNQDNAQTSREQTIVYATREYARDAAAIAKALAGGARTAPLTWKSSFDVVVAVGTATADAGR